MTDQPLERAKTWQMTYTDGSWLALAGTRAALLLPPPPARAGVFVRQLWTQVDEAADVTELAATLAGMRVDTLPAFAAFFLAPDGLRVLLRGPLTVLDVASGEIVAEAQGAVTWQEVSLAEHPRVLVNIHPTDGDLLQLPLVHGAALVSRFLLDATHATPLVLPVSDAAAEVPEAAAEPVVATEPEPEPTDDAEPEPVVATEPDPAAEPEPTEEVAPALEAEQADAELASMEESAPALEAAEVVEAEMTPPIASEPSADVAAEAESESATEPEPPADAPAVAEEVPVAEQVEDALAPAAAAVEEPIQTQEAATEPEPAPEPEPRQAELDDASVVPDAAALLEADETDDEEDFSGTIVAPPAWGKGPAPAPVPATPQAPQLTTPVPPPAIRPGFGTPILPPPGEPIAQPPYGAAPVGQQPAQPYGQPVPPPPYGQPAPYGQPPAPAQSYGQPAQPYGQPVPPAASGQPLPQVPGQYPAPAPQQPQSAVPQQAQGQQPPPPQAPAPLDHAPTWRHASPAAPASADDEHDGATIYQTQIAVTHKPLPGEGGGDEFLLAATCPMGHANPPSAMACSRCGTAVDRANAHLVARPAVAAVVSSAGDRVDLVTRVLVGRAPTQQPGTPEAALLQVPSPQSDISRTHLEISTREWDVWATDLHSTNGTELLFPSGERRKLAPGAPTQVQPGTILDLGDGVTLTLQPPA